MKPDVMATALFFASLALMMAAGICVAAGICAGLDEMCATVLSLASVCTTLVALFVLLSDEVR